MKKFIHLIGIMSFLFASCEQEIMTYEGEEAIYFDVRYGSSWGDPENEWAHQYYTPVEFGRLNDESYTAQLRVKATGTVKDYDRPFSVTVLEDSTTAIKGSEFELQTNNFVIKAGETHAYIDVLIHRTERMSEENVYLMLQLQENEHFTLRFSDYGDSAGHWAPETLHSTNTDASVHKLVINDLLVKPNGWIGTDDAGLGLFGKFSPTKYRLMMEVTNTEMDDYAVRNTGFANAVSEKFARYLLEKAALGRDHVVLDEDGTMMWCMYVQSSYLGGDKAWQPFTDPDEYYK